MSNNIPTIAEAGMATQKLRDGCGVGPGGFSQERLKCAIAQVNSTLCNLFQ